MTWPAKAVLTGDDICSALGVKVKSHSPVLALCRMLVNYGHDPAMLLDVYRGDTLALRVRSIGAAAGLRVAPHGVGFVRENDRAPDELRGRGLRQIAEAAE
jgi:hypothetical protein